MCFHSKQSKSAQDLKNRFKAKFEDELKYTPSIYNGFKFPKTPVITNAEPDNIQMFNWGLLPTWAKDKDFRQNTLNAKIETIKEKPSFRNLLNKRCLVLSDGFYEWQWLDYKGKQKQKYLISTPEKDAFAFAGLWNIWVDKNTGEILHTYTIITREANELMSKIHNIKKRMPFILPKEFEYDWLSGNDFDNYNIELIAEAI